MSTKDSIMFFRLRLLFLKVWFVVQCTTNSIYVSSAIRARDRDSLDYSRFLYKSFFKRNLMVQNVKSLESSLHKTIKNTSKNVC
jgi:hypothetical protein